MKRSASEQLSDNQKRFNANILQHSSVGPPSPSNSYHNNQYYNGNQMHDQYSGMMMFNQSFPMYNSQNQMAWQNYCSTPGPSSLMFNPSQPPPPLPAEPPKKPKPPPPPPPESLSPIIRPKQSNSPRQPTPITPSPPVPRLSTHRPGTLGPMSPMRMRGRGTFLRPGLHERGGHKRLPFVPRIFNPNHCMNTIRHPLNPLGFRRNVEEKLLTSYIVTNKQADGTDVETTESHILVNKKSKRKPMSTRYTRKREWAREDALKAIELEKEFNSVQRTTMLILKFPDPEISKEIVKQYSPLIETVHFQQPSTPRYCFVQLKEGADIEKVRQHISQIPFGTGKIVADRKRLSYEDPSVLDPEEIDPYTLYIGNLPTTVSVALIKKNFPKAVRIDIGYAQRLKYTRYAFIRYNNVQDAMEAFRQTFDLLIESRSLIVRFRRQKGNVGLPGEAKIQRKKNAEQVATQIQDPIAKDNATISENNSIIIVDSKDNVLEEAETLMHNLAKDKNLTEPAAFRIKSEKPDEIDKSSRPEDDDDQYEGDLLGTKVKDEPPEDYDYDDDAVHDYYHDMEDDELDMIPDEEDDIVDDEYIPNDDEEEDDDDDVGAFGHHHWEELRRKEFDMKEEKPDVSLLPSIGLKKTNEISDLLNEDKDKQSEDDLDELFNSMNPEDEDSV